jgi:hypothetical protein
VFDVDTLVFTVTVSLITQVPEEAAVKDPG